MAMGPSSRDEATKLARAVYASSLRPRSLDELHARVLTGDAPPSNATKPLRELAELRASVTGDDAPSRHLLASIASQVGASGLLVVMLGSHSASASDADAGVDSDGGSPVAPKPTARLFLSETGEFDAARYEPDETGSWRGTVTSLASSGRFPPPVTAPAVAAPSPSPPKLSSEGKDSKPFYASPWFWGAIGGALLLGGFFYFTTQDSSNDPIHLQMKVPR